ncbi:transposable element Tcb1 transposase [Trichonephila clavipes]|uniref:Transposable element Tcb1 transposase n=1 Tax=Trichonephila clavipes TaxID=2585209 RepID=A0A8X6W124_TRICX|nr:transposable element Tcb1 transposase [Trichonephila clavipes]
MEESRRNGSVVPELLSRRKQRPASDQVTEFDRGRIVAYRYCRLSFRLIGSRVGRNQTTVMRIWDRWLQEGTTDRRGRLYPPQCTTSLRIAGTLNSQRNIYEVLEPVDLPYPQGLAPALFQQDNVRPHVARIVQRFFVNHQIELLSWPVCSPDLSPIENMWSMVAQRLTQITPPAATPDQLWQRVEAAWSDLPQEHIQNLFKSMPRRVAALISNYDGYSGY